MTPRERAAAVIDSEYGWVKHEREFGIAAIERAIYDAVKAEREACAKVADQQHALHCSDGCTCTAAEDTADAIRARKDGDS